MKLSKAILAALLLVLSAVGYLHLPLLESKPKEIVLIQQQIIDPYVELHFTYDDKGEERTFKGSGTVIKLNNERYILTAGHMYEDSLPLVKIEVHKNDKVCLATYICSEYDIDGGLDACLIKPTYEDWLVPAYFSFAKINVKNAEECYYIGTPAGFVHASLEKTLVSAIRPYCDGEECQFYRINGNGFYGNSGGGFFIKRNDTWFLAGIVARKYNYADNGPMLVIKHEKVVKFLKNCLDKI